MHTRCPAAHSYTLTLKKKNTIAKDIERATQRKDETTKKFCEALTMYFDGIQSFPSELYGIGQAHVPMRDEDHILFH